MTAFLTEEGGTLDQMECHDPLEPAPAAHGVVPGCGFGPSAAQFAIDAIWRRLTIDVPPQAGFLAIIHQVLKVFRSIVREIRVGR